MLGTGRFVPEELVEELLLAVVKTHELLVTFPVKPVPVGKTAVPEPVGSAGALPLVKAYGAVAVAEDKGKPVGPRVPLPSAAILSDGNSHVTIACAGTVPSHTLLLPSNETLTT